MEKERQTSRGIVLLDSYLRRARRRFVAGAVGAMEQRAVVEEDTPISRHRPPPTLPASAGQCVEMWGARHDEKLPGVCAVGVQGPRSGSEIGSNRSSAGD